MLSHIIIIIYDNGTEQNQNHPITPFIHKSVHR